MDNSTFVDSELAAYMNDNVIAKRIDIQDFDGFRWSQQYDVDALPTMLIFNRDGSQNELSDIKQLNNYLINLALSIRNKPFSCPNR